MPVNTNSQVSTIYIGNNVVTKIYLGSTQIYSSS